MAVRRIILCLALLLALAACGPLARVAPANQATSSAPVSLVPVRVSASPLAGQSGCSGTFVPHTLDFTTTIAGDAVHLFDSNGAGVAIGDLDEDGRPDLAFANLDGPNAIFWNQGGLHFRKQTLDDTSSRAVSIVDVDGDGRLDVVFTHRGGGVGIWRNTGRPSSSKPPSQPSPPSVPITTPTFP